MTIAQWLPPAVREAPEDQARLLDALLAAVDTQVDLLAADVDQIWQDAFIESCADWAVPYIGALLGLPADAERREVAYAIALRRRKGTPGALEDFAEVVTGLPARVVEGWQVTTWVQRLAHPRPLRPAILSLSDTLRAGTPFERSRRTLTPGGRWSPRAATVVVWPWQVYTLSEVEAAPLAEARRYALHPLGAQAPLYVRPRPLRLGSEETGSARTGDERDAPVRATYDVIRALAAPGDIAYGGNLTLAASHPLADPPLVRISAGGVEVPWTALRFGSLPDGPAPFPPGNGEAVVDVARGRVELGTGHPSGPVRATWHRPVAGSMGALACASDENPAARVVVVVDPDGSGPNYVGTLDDAFTLARLLETAPGLDPAASRPDVPDVEIRLRTSDRLAAPVPQVFTPVLPRWRIVAPPLLTPTIVGDLDLDLDGACLSIEGCYLAGDLLLRSGLRGAVLDGITMDPTSEVLVDDDAWSLDFVATRCLLGPIRADLAAFPLVLTDCVVDGRRARLLPCGGVAAGAPVDAVARRTRFGPALEAVGVTFAGPVRVESADAVDCVFADGVEVVQQQEGCLRHCYTGPPLTVPPRHPTTYRCGPFPAPAFVSDGFEAAGYYALALEPDQPLLSAASDGGEVGAYHHVRRAARLRRLRRRVDEFVPLGLRSAVALAPWEE